MYQSKMAARGLIFAFLLYISVYFVESSSPVPVLMWSKDSSVYNDQPILAGHTLSGDDFQERFLRKLLTKPQTIVIFLQDRLSIDDFSHYGDAYSTGSHGEAFSNLKVAMDTANSSLVLPSVNGFSNSDNLQLETFINSVIKGKLIRVNNEELESFSASRYDLDNKVTNVFIIHLHPVSSRPMEEAEKVFVQNDKTIADVTKNIADVSPSYTCILTASSPNKEISDDILQEEISKRPHDRLRRSLSDKVSEGDVKNLNGSLLINGKNCLFIYMSGLVMVGDNQTVDFFNGSSNPSGQVLKTFCSNKTDANITFSLDFGNSKKPQLEFYFSRSRYDWKCTTIKFSFDKAKFTVPCNKDVQVPSKMSYHCYESVFRNANYTLKFKHLQVQPYDIKNNKFSYAYDCVGFFSVPILMGLLVTSMLLVILFFGIMAVFSITTMDRFDDPKSSMRSFGATTG